MQHLKTYFKLIAIILFLETNLSFASEDNKSKEVIAFVEEVGNKIVSIAGDKKISEANRREKIVSIVDKSTDSKWIARFVLGKNFKSISEEQQQRFVKLYREFMINTYGPKFNSYHGKKFNVKSVDKQSMFYIAKAEFLPIDSNQSISIDFRVKENDGKLIIVDFIAEGISLIETQRSEFNSAIADNGIEEFLNKLQVRTNELKKQR